MSSYWHVLFNILSQRTENSNACFYLDANLSNLNTHTNKCTITMHDTETHIYPLIHTSFQNVPFLHPDYSYFKNSTQHYLVACLVYEPVHEIPNNEVCATSKVLE